MTEAGLDPPDQGADAASIGRPRPLVDPVEQEERLGGASVSREQTPELERGLGAVCVDLPRLAEQRDGLAPPPSSTQTTTALDQGSPGAVGMAASELGPGQRRTGLEGERQGLHGLLVEGDP